MGRELQKRKARSSRAKIRQPVRRRKALNPSGSQLIAQNWNKKETLSQNYRRLGLVAKLGHTAGGVDPAELAAPTSLDQQQQQQKKKKTAGAGAGKDGKNNNPLAMHPSIAAQVYSEARVERDPVTGRIVRVLTATSADARSNPLNDPLKRFDSDEEEGQDEDEEGAEEWGGIDDSNRPAVVRQLEAEANAPREKTVRHQSGREVEWLRRLVGRHGDDVAAMARDPRLNPMQQTANDIRRRLRKAGLVEG